MTELRQRSLLLKSMKKLLEKRILLIKTGFNPEIENNELLNQNDLLLQ